MHLVLLLLTLTIMLPQELPAQPLRIDDSLVVSPGDTNYFWVQVPEGYNPAQPPAILVWWHGYGSDRHELQNLPGWADSLNSRRWIGACHTGGPNTHHYNGRIAQNHCRTMLDWIMANYPFSRDSVYMAGSSMGAAAPFIWHNNHCGVLEYPLAAAAGGSPILDCELRQHQYIDSGHIINAMIEDFGGIPDTSDSVDFQYHRTSAVHFADTTQSMHFNSLHLPCYARWGTTDSTYLAEWFAYGHPCQRWDTLRQAGNAETTDVGCSGLAIHGGANLRIDSTLNWLSSFSVNRFPPWISIDADEADEYYWTRVTLQNTAYVFGRYGVERNFDERRLDINLIRNIDTLEVEFLFPWAEFDTLHGNWLNRDSAYVPEVFIMFTHLPTPVTALTRNGEPYFFNFSDSTFITWALPSGEYRLSFDLYSGEQPPALPKDLRLISAYPNPFNSQIVLEITANTSGRHSIEVYDITGRLSRSLMVNLTPGGQHLTVSGDGLASGIYFVTLSESAQRPLKVVLLK
jgi:hypothetical protein